LTVTDVKAWLDLHGYKGEARQDVFELLFELDAACIEYLRKKKPKK